MNDEVCVAGPEWAELVLIAGHQNLLALFEQDGKELPLIVINIASGFVHCKSIFDDRKFVLQKACYRDPRDRKRRQTYLMRTVK